LTATLKVIFFDAAGTLFHLPRGVGYHYALVAGRMGLQLDATALDRAFAAVWREMPARPAIGAPRPDDDRGWWRDLVDRVFDRVARETAALDRDAFFEVAYDHFAEAGVWELFPEVYEVLEQLEPRYELGVISNFDGRLRMVLEQLGVSRFFRHLSISSEVGADKPDPFIFRRALDLSGYEPADALYVGDDPAKDWEGAAAVGMRVLRLRRPENSLRDLLSEL